MSERILETAEDWTASRSVRRSWGIHYGEQPHVLAIRMQLINDALPPDHPLKITRADVATLRELADWSRVSDGECPKCGGGGWKMPARPICTTCGFQPPRNEDVVRDATYALAAKLNALLPPEGV